MFYKCPRCGELFASNEQPLARCLACGALLRVAAAVPNRGAAEAAAPLSAFTGVAWQQRDRSLPSRFWRTLRQLLAQAPQFFFSFDDDTAAKSARRAETFAYLCSLIGISGFFATQLWLAGRAQNDTALLLASIAEASGRSLRPDGLRKVFAWGFALSPLLAFLPAHMAAGLYHLALSAFVQRRRSYDITFTVVAYGMAPMLLLALPPIGPLLAPGWILALHWVGLAVGQRVPFPVALFLMLMPWLTVAMLFLRVLAQLLVLALTVPA